MKLALRLMIFLTLIGNIKFAWTTELSEPLALSEAEILIYLMPASRQLRLQGFDVGWDLERSSIQGADSFRFRVFNAKRKCPERCSVTIGYFAVEKHTAEVDDLDAQRIVTDEEIRGVQAILRKEHHLASKHSE
jgi:hypothetical protein